MATIEIVTDQLWHEASNRLSELSADDLTNEYFTVDASVTLSSNVKGDIRLENGIDTLRVIMPYVGHDYVSVPTTLHSRASQETQGSQHLEFKGEQVRAFFNFLLQSVAFKFEEVWKPWTTIIVEGVVDDEDEDDVLTKPRLQCSFITYEKDSEGKRVISETSEMYLPFTLGNRRAILDAILHDLEQHKLLTQSPLELLIRTVRDLFTKNKKHRS